MGKLKSVSTISVETELLEEAKKRGINISRTAQEALAQRLKGSSYLSPEEKARLEELEAEKKAEEEKILKRYEYLDNMKDIVMQIDQILWPGKEAFLNSEIPTNFSEESETVKIWTDAVEFFRQAGIKIGTKQLEIYWKWKKFGNLEAII